MQTIETEFDYTIERDDVEIDLYITVSGDLQGREPEVGYNDDWVGCDEITATDSLTGKVINLTQWEERAIRDKATCLLNEQLHRLAA